jgi:hypothetical protein
MAQRAVIEALGTVRLRRQSNGRNRVRSSAVVGRVMGPGWSCWGLRWTRLAVNQAVLLGE